MCCCSGGSGGCVRGSDDGYCSVVVGFGKGVSSGSGGCIVVGSGGGIW